MATLFGFGDCQIQTRCPLCVNSKALPLSSLNIEVELFWNNFDPIDLNAIFPAVTTKFYCRHNRISTQFIFRTTSKTVISGDPFFESYNLFCLFLNYFLCFMVLFWLFCGICWGLHSFLEYFFFFFFTNAILLGEKKKKVIHLKHYA